MKGLVFFRFLDMNEFHNKCLKSCCLICGLKDSNNVRAFSWSGKRNQGVYKKIMDENTNHLVPQPKFPCKNCRTTILSDLAKARSQKDIDAATEAWIERLHIFKNHSDDCPVCNQFEKEVDPGPSSGSMNQIPEDETGHELDLQRDISDVDSVSSSSDNELLELLPKRKGGQMSFDTSEDDMP